MQQDLIRYRTRPEQAAANEGAHPGSARRKQARMLKERITEAHEPSVPGQT
jgi:hypothetical protein